LNEDKFLYNENSSSDDFPVFILAFLTHSSYFPMILPIYWIKYSHTNEEELYHLYLNSFHEMLSFPYFILMKLRYVFLHFVCFYQDLKQRYIHYPRRSFRFSIVYGQYLFLFLLSDYLINFIQDNASQ